MAQQHGVPVTGTIGLLVIGVQHQRWSLIKANTALADMIALGFHSPVTRLDDLMAGLSRSEARADRQLRLPFQVVRLLPFCK